MTISQKTDANGGGAAPAEPALLDMLTLLNQSGAAHMSATGVALERCRLAAEWKQTVQEQGTLLTEQIRSQMADLAAHLKRANATNWRGLVSPIGLSAVANVSEFEQLQKALSLDLNDLVQAHTALDDCMLRIASLLMEVESCSEQVIRSSERIRLNGLVSFDQDEAQH